uniref:PID domain-containing protein n=1 Tax=Strongyloides papillosus TaxID=174720 RepID=A0A0N5B8H5_STREA
MIWLLDKKKSKNYFYVWYLGVQETNCLRDENETNFLMNEKLKNFFGNVGNKATISLSQKRLKLIQTIPMMNKSGYIKMKSMYINIPTHCITFSMIGNMPFNDTIAVTMIILNPEMNSPIHVHFYRCDTSQIAQLFHEKIQYLINLSNNKRLLHNLEQRLYLKNAINSSKNLSEFNASNFMRNNTVISDFVKSDSVKRQKLSSRHSIAVLPSDYNFFDNKITNKLEFNTINLSREEKRKSMENLLLLSQNVKFHPDITTSKKDTFSQRIYVKKNNNTYSSSTHNSSLGKLFKRKRLPSSMLSSSNH